MQTKPSPNYLPWWILIIPVLLILLYGWLSWQAWFDPTWFYGSMKATEHGFLLFSWGGKNAAILVGLLLASIYRRKLPLVIALMTLIVAQLSDIFAGVKTDVTTSLSYVGLILVMIELFLLWLIEQEKKKPTRQKTG